MKRERKYKPTNAGDIELSDEQHEKVQKAIAQAEADIEAARVSFRWTKQHVDLVKSVAAKIGVPYQTYIKQIIYKQAVADSIALACTSNSMYPAMSQNLISEHDREYVTMRFTTEGDVKVTPILSAKSARRVLPPLGQSVTSSTYGAKLDDLRRANFQ